MASDTRPNALLRRGLMFILSSPSGAGKTTISRMLLDRDPEISLSVSATTRPMRPGEVDGVHYHFVDQSTFDRMVEADEFYEWATVFGHSYGTPKAQIRAGLKEGRDYLFDIDWQGTQQLYQKDQQDVVRVFILPPSLEELQRRLTGRGTDSAEVIAARMERQVSASLMVRAFLAVAAVGPCFLSSASCFWRSASFFSIAAISSLSSAGSGDMAARVKKNVVSSNSRSKCLLSTTRLPDDHRG